MKKIFKYVLLLVLLTGCYEFEDSKINNPGKKTTLESIDAIDSTLNVAIVDNEVYLFRDGKLEHKFIANEHDASGPYVVCITFMFMFLLIFMLIILFND